jgi:hypothetical protein
LHVPDVQRPQKHSRASGGFPPAAVISGIGRKPKDPPNKTPVPRAGPNPPARVPSSERKQWCSTRGLGHNERGLPLSLAFRRGSWVELGAWPAVRPGATARITASPARSRLRITTHRTPVPAVGTRWGRWVHGSPGTTMRRVRTIWASPTACFRVRCVVAAATTRPAARRLGGTSTPGSLPWRIAGRVMLHADA